MLHRKLTFCRVGGFLLAGTMIQSTMVIGLSTVFLPGSIKAEDTANIAGIWTAPDGSGAVVPENTRTIIGIVTGPDGAVIADAKVTATNVDTKSAVTASTTSDGSYTILNLTSGAYKVAIDATGFKKLIVDVETRDSETVRKDITMKPAGLNFFEKLLVTGAVVAGDAYLQELQNKTDDAASSDQEQTVEREDGGRWDNHKDRDANKDREKHKTAGRER